jgi:uncharacterized YccA/Bax inhibitor family protein
MASPFFNEQKILDARGGAYSDRMTVSGAVNKSFILLAILMATGIYSYMAFNPLLMMIGAIGGLIVAIIAAFRPQNANILAPIYAGLEGLFVGGLSAMYALRYDGIVFQAVTLTIGVLFAMLFFYKSGIIKVTAGLRSGIMMATAGIAIFYLITFALSFFNVHVPYIHENGMIGIGFSLFVVGLAAMNLLLDFDTFEKGEQMGASKDMEWYAAMGLMVTLIWLYVEILRLLSKLSSRD